MKAKRTRSTRRQTQVRKLIERLGGAVAVASALGKSPSTVHRWSYSREDGGTGGAIPIQLVHYIVKLARQKKVQLTTDDRGLFVQIKRKRVH